MSPPPRRGRHLSLRLALLLASLLALASTVACRRAQPPAPIRVDGLALFEVVVPLLLHPRCANCHGLSDPFTGHHHPGPAIARVPGHPGFGCAACHDDGSMEPPISATARATARATVSPVSAEHRDSDWHLPRPERDFVGKSARDLCLQLRDAFPGLPGDPSDFFEHLEHDQRIRLGFLGAKGIRSDGATLATRVLSEPPPMSPRQFVAAMRAWVEQGHADCGAERDGR